MRIVCVSDTHTMLSRIKVPDGDVLIHAGDLTFRGTYEEIFDELNAIRALPHRRKIVVPGNHDFYFDERFPDGHSFRNWYIDRPLPVSELLAQFPDIDVLIDRAVDVDGLKVYGSPWQPAFYDWAFQFAAGELGDTEAQLRWALIPLDTDVLVTHSPPWGIRDIVTRYSEGDMRAGDRRLLQRIGALERLKLHVFGHLHDGYGVLNAERADGSRIIFANAASNTNAYLPLNAPLVIDL